RTLALAEHRVLQFALGIMRRLALRDGRVFGARQRLARGLESLAGRLDGFLAAREGKLASGERVACFFGFTVDLADFGTSLAVALRRLRKLQLVDFRVMARLLHARDLLASGFQRLRSVGCVPLRRLLRGFGAPPRLLQPFAAFLEDFDLRLPRKQPGVDRVRRMEADRVTRELMPLAVDEKHPRPQALAK